MTLLHELPALFTSRWQNKKLAELGVVPVGISRGTPRFKLPYRYRMLRLLAPYREAFGIEDNEGFERTYLRQLEELGVEYIANRLRRISHEHGGRPLVLLCFEDALKGRPVTGACSPTGGRIRLARRCPNWTTALRSSLGRPCRRHRSRLEARSMTRRRGNGEGTITRRKEGG
jgi:hypothetical protein